MYCNRGPENPGVTVQESISKKNYHSLHTQKKVMTKDCSPSV